VVVDRRRHWRSQWRAPSAPFTPRIKLAALTLNNQLCVVAGDDGTRTHDMWCSADGAQWRLAATANMQF